MDTRRPLGKYKRPLPPKHTPVSSDAETQIALERYLAVSGWLGLLLVLLVLVLLLVVLVVACRRWCWCFWDCQIAACPGTVVVVSGVVVSDARRCVSFSRLRMPGWQH
jgi:hypothetical protein